MAFLGAIIQAIIKLVKIGAGAFGGILLGKHLRKKHDENQQDEKQA